MKKQAVLVLVAVSFLMVSSCAQQKEQKSAYLAKVGKVLITQDDVTREIKALPEQIQKMFEGLEGTEKFVDELVKKELLYQEAKKQGLDSNADYQKKVEEFKKLTLISMVLKKEIEDKVKITEKDAKDYYEAHKGDLFSTRQVRASHILLQDEQEAKKVLEQIKAGGDFAKIARERSKDAGSAKNGGDLGFLSKGQVVPEFEAAAFSLKEGEVGGPVKTRFGYHIIKVTGKKDGPAVEFEKVKDPIMQRLTAEKQKEAFDSYINNLKKTYTVEIRKEAIGKGTGPAELTAPKAGEPKTEKPTAGQNAEQKPEGKK